MVKLLHISFHLKSKKVKVFIKCFLTFTTPTRGKTHLVPAI